MCRGLGQAPSIAAAAAELPSLGSELNNGSALGSSESLHSFIIYSGHFPLGVIRATKKL